jgi:oxalate decarboxylase
MSSIQRRDFLTGAAAFAAGVTAALAATRRAEAGDPSFMNNVPDPLVSGKELPTFKFALEKSKGKVMGGSTAKEATVEQFSISKGIAGVSMGLEPGAMRELHWHATAAEWAFRRTCGWPRGTPPTPSAAARRTSRRACPDCGC